MINVALFVAMKREDAMDLSRRTIDRLRRARGVLRAFLRMRSDVRGYP
jgi:hypothetical protein